jgi:hypothetical protein
LTAVLAALTVLAFRDVVLEGRTLQTTNLAHGTLDAGAYGYEGPLPGHAPVIDPGASAWNYVPWARLPASLRSDGTPLWNPYAGLGSPFAANAQSGVFALLRWPLFIFWSPAFWDGWLLFRLLLAGLGAAAFARARGMSLLAALLVGIAFELCGYLVGYANMSHLDVEVLLPWVLLAFDRLAERRDAGSLVLAALGTALSILGGMPESTFFVLALAGLYFAHRSWGSAGSRLGAAARFVAAVAAGHLLSAFQLLPFAEYLSLAVTAHPAGTGAKTLPPATAVTLLAPYFFSELGYEHMSLATLVGTVPCVLALLALAGRRQDRLAGFFAAFAAVSLLTVFGAPGTRWIGSLPVFDRCTITKYAMVEIALAVAVLAGLGVDALRAGRVRASHALAAGGAVVAALVVLALVNERGLAAAGLWERSRREAGVALAFAVLAAALVTARAVGAFPRLRLEALLVLLAAFELLVYVPRERPARWEPFVKPPFVELLQREPEPRRVLSFDKLLYPETGTAYGIEDPRILDALMPVRTQELFGRLIPDLVNDRLGAGESAALAAKLRVLDLLAVTHVVASQDLLDPSRVLEIVAQRQFRGRAGSATWTGGGAVEPILVAPPPCEVFATIDVPRTDPVLRFTPVVLGGDAPVTFTVLSVNQDGQAQTLLDRSVPPGSPAAAALVDLSSVAGGRARLVFSTQGPGAKAAGWVGLRLARELPGLSCAYVGSDARVYRNERALPRARLVHRARWVPDGAAALDALSDPSYTGRDETILEGSAGAAASALPATPLRIAASARHVRVSCDAREPGWVVLADAWFPGWRATVDGAPAEVLHADYVFRAVAVGPGIHTVAFDFEPASFHAGVALAAGAAAALAIFLVRSRSRGPSSRRGGA